MKDRILQLITISFLTFALSVNAWALSDTLDPATPAGSESPTQGDDRIRELKRAFIERFQVEHTFPESGGVYDGATVGYHKLIRLPEQSSAPSTPASYGALYTKDTGGQPELFFREESSGDEVQLTSAGSLNITLTPAASAAEVTTGTEAAKYVAPLTVVSHEGVVKAWGKISYSGGTPTLDDSFNITSISDDGTGKVGVTIATDFANDDYSVMGACNRTDSAGSYCGFSYYAATTGTITLQFYAAGDGSEVDPTEATFALIGDR